MRTVLAGEELHLSVPRDLEPKTELQPWFPAGFPTGFIGLLRPRGDTALGAEIVCGLIPRGRGNLVRRIGARGWRPFSRLSWLLAALLLGGTQSAFAAAPAPTSEPLFVVQIVLLLVVGRLLGEAMQRIGQPAIMGQLLAGLLLGPSALGAALPGVEQILFPPSGGQKAMLDGVAQLGILLMLLLTGMEMDLALIARMRRAAISVSMAGIAVPFGLGVALGWSLPDGLLPRPELRLITALFLGTALAISSVKIVAAVVQDMGFLRRRVGQLIVASAIIDDTIGWIVIAIIFGLALHGGIEPVPIAISVLGTLLFLAFSLTLGQRIVSATIRWVNDRFVSEFAVITAILVMMGGMALITSAIGVHTVLGAFVAGLLVGRSPILTQHIREQLRGLTMALFMPVFFGTAGLSADLTVLRDPTLLMVAVGLVLIASLGKFAGAYLGGTLASLPRGECLALACGMNARGSTEVVIATIGLSMGALSQPLYSMIVAMAVITTTAMPPMLRWALGRLTISPEEQQRLDREELDAQGFVAKLERLLVTSDRSASGRLAARLAGMLAASRRMPLTVLEMERDIPARTSTTGASTAVEPAVVTSEAVARGVANDAAGTPQATTAEPDITAHRREGAPEAAVAQEARKGYDLLLVGLDDETTAEDGAQGQLPRLATSFPGPVCIVQARGIYASDPAGPSLDLLVPVSGTTESRRALEMAIALVQAGSGALTLLFVELRSRDARRDNLRRRLLGTEGMELREAVVLLERYNIKAKTVVRHGVAIEDAIIAQASKGRNNLVILGVRPRSSDTRFFGAVAAEVLGRAPCSVLLVSG